MTRLGDVLRIVLGIAFVFVALNTARNGVDLAGWPMRVASASVLAATFVATLRGAIKSGARATGSELRVTIWSLVGISILAMVLMRALDEVGVREIAFWLVAVVATGMVAAAAVAMVLGYPKDSVERQSEDRTTSP